MNTEKFSNSLHALAVKFGQSGVTIKSLLVANQPVSTELWSAHAELASKLAGLCFSATLLLPEDELHRLIYRTGLTEEVFARAAGEIEKEVQP